MNYNPHPITIEIERDLINAGAFDETGLIVRPKLRGAYDRICHNNRHKFPCRFDDANAELFLLMILRQSKHCGKSFDETAESMGY